MKSKYHVIWIDDEWESMTSFITYCKLQYQIELCPFKTHKQGHVELAKNPDFYEAAILDARSLYDDENTIADENNMFKSILHLNREFKELPYFISTGQASLISEEWFKKQYGEFYRKEIDDDKLCKDIITTIEDKPNRKVINKYPDLFSCLPQDIFEEVLDILKIQENRDYSNADVFNKIRKVLDWLMRRLNEYGLLAIPFDGSNLAECSRFLGDKALMECLPLYIQRQLFSLTTVSNEGSHRLLIDNDVKAGVAPYLVPATIYEFINVLTWYLQLPVDPDQKMKMVTPAKLVAEKYSSSQEQEPILNITDYEGKEFFVEKDEHNKYHCEMCQIPPNAAQYFLGKKVILQNVQKGKGNYPLYAQFKPVDTPKNGSKNDGTNQT